MKPRKKKKPSHQIDRFISVIALVTIVIAWIIGTFRSEIDLNPFLKQTFPEADHFEYISKEIYSMWKGKFEKQLIGYLTTGTAHGYGGTMKLIVAVSPKGIVLNQTIVYHKETFSFLKRVQKSDLLKSLTGKNYSDPFLLNQDIDGVSGATYTSQALATAVYRGTRKIAKRILHLSIPPEPPTKIQFNFPEILLLVIFVLTFITTRQWFKYKRLLRWIIMITGLSILGFMLNKPFTLIFINKILLGFWPNWQTHLYWYILILGILFFLIIENKSLYCDRICPFGATQELIGTIGGAKTYTPNHKYRNIFRWIQRGIAWSVILAALVLSNPSLITYEISGALFHLIGSNFQFVLLGIVLITALFFKRSWCNYLCPLRPTFDFIRLFRNWIKELWVKKTEN